MTPVSTTNRFLRHKPESLTVAAIVEIPDLMEISASPYCLTRKREPKSASILFTYERRPVRSPPSWPTNFSDKRRWKWQLPSRKREDPAWKMGASPSRNDTCHWPSPRDCIGERRPWPMDSLWCSNTSSLKHINESQRRISRSVVVYAEKKYHQGRLMIKWAPTYDIIVFGYSTACVIAL